MANRALLESAVASLEKLPGADILAREAVRVASPRNAHRCRDHISIAVPIKELHAGRIKFLDEKGLLVEIDEPSNSKKLIGLNKLEENMHSVVAVNQTGSPQIGSGFHIGNGRFLTAFHCVGNDKTGELHPNLVAILLDNRTIPVEVVGANQSRDIAILQTAKDIRDLPVLKLAGQTPTEPEFVYSLGRPFPTYQYLEIARGTANTFRPTSVPFNSNSLVRGGMSGGPIVNKDWQVLSLTAQARNSALARARVKTSVLGPNLWSLKSLTHAVETNSSRRLVLSGMPSVDEKYNQRYSEVLAREKYDSTLFDNLRLPLESSF